MSLVLVGKETARMEKVWLIVEMEDEERVISEIVPKSWFDPLTQECFWPPRKNANPLIRRCERPGKEWQRYRSRVLGEFGKYLQILY